MQAKRMERLKIEKTFLENFVIEKELIKFLDDMIEMPDNFFQTKADRINLEVQALKNRAFYYLTPQLINARKLHPVFTIGAEKIRYLLDLCQDIDNTLLDEMWMEKNHDKKVENVRGDIVTLPQKQLNKLKAEQKAKSTKRKFVENFINDSTNKFEDKLNAVKITQKADQDLFANAIKALMKKN